MKLKNIGKMKGIRLSHPINSTTPVVVTDMGTVNEPVTTTVDSGSVNDPVTAINDYGRI